MRTPKTKKQLQAVLGLVNYYQQFIANRSMKTAHEKATKTIITTQKTQRQKRKITKGRCSLPMDIRNDP